MATQVILLGTGTPNACPDASGPATAIIVNNKPYLFDCGPGIIRQATKAYRKGIKALSPKNLKTLFITHLHSDHTVGLSDFIFTPWVLERDETMQIYGPRGTQEMYDHLVEAYKIDIDFRIHGFEKANEQGFLANIHTIQDGLIYQDENIQVEAFTVSHGTLECYGFKIVTKDKTIVLSGDTCPLEIMKEKAKDVDILIHEVFYSEGLKQRTPQWQKYHQSVHTSSYDLAKIAKAAHPKLLVTYHRIYHFDMYNDDLDIDQEVKKRSESILTEIKSIYDGEVVNGQDLDIFE